MTAIDGKKSVMIESCVEFVLSTIWADLFILFSLHYTLPLYKYRQNIFLCNLLHSILVCTLFISSNWLAAWHGFSFIFFQQNGVHLASNAKYWMGKTTPISWPFDGIHRSEIISIGTRTSHTDYGIGNFVCWTNFEIKAENRCFVAEASFWGQMWMVFGSTKLRNTKIDKLID